MWERKGSVGGAVRTVLAYLCAATLVSAVLVAGEISSPQPAQAVAGSEFDPGYIVSDAVFFNKDAMTEAQVQAFLESMLPTCAQANGVPCIKNYTETTGTEPASAKCNAYEGAANERASTIIYRVAQACGINPQVLLVMLQKEQGLITNGSPTATRYRIAMGYACPDTAECDTRYYGFFNQLHSAAWQMKQYTQSPDTRTYRIGNVPIQYHPNAACGAPVVNIRNQATANLYNYTPYQPNAAALANLSGTGDACSSYGNRNFWVYFNSWFGSPTGAVNPFGKVESVDAAIGGIRITGWAIDPSTPSPMPIHVYVDGVGTAIGADQPRADIGAAYPSFGPNHGYSALIPVTSSGAHSVCIYGYNLGPGANVLFGCYTVTTSGGSPVGVIDPVTTAPASVTVTGWAIDPDTADPITVHVYVDGFSVATVADISRTDALAAYPAYGDKHGYSQTVTTTPGSHRVCAYGINTGAGTHALLGCRVVTVPSAPGVIPELGRAPFGGVEDVSAAVGTVTVSGWAIDPDTASPIAVHIYVDGWSMSAPADLSRADVAAAYPAYGDKHGYVQTINATPGSHYVCVYGINSGPGTHTMLGCRTVTVPAPPGAIPELGRVPFGGVEGASASEGSVTVSGWAIDPDTAASITVHVYIDGFSVGIAADLSRSDVAAAYPAYGDKHGYVYTGSATPGSHRICVYAINAGPGIHPLLGCRTVTVPSPPGGLPELGRAPFGVIEDVSSSAGTITVSGWAIDPDTAASIAVHVYIDAFSVAVPADLSRSDVAAAYPPYGDKHAYTYTTNATPGAHKVCVYGINAGPGAHTLFGCRTVTV